MCSVAGRMLRFADQMRVQDVSKAGAQGGRRR